MSFAPRFAGRAAERADARLSWNGLAGAGIGGMSANSSGMSVIATGYHQPTADELTGIPVQTAATKSLEARWSAPLADSPVVAMLKDSDGLVAGAIENKTQLRLQNVRLMFGNWAYRLKDIEPSASVTIDGQLTPISIQTLVTGAAIGGVATGGSQRPLLETDHATAAQLLNAMMFYEAAGGARYTGLPFRFERFCDLTRTLAVGRAVLVAEVQTPGSQLLGLDADPAPSADGDSSRLVVYRFVLPVGKGE